MNLELESLEIQVDETEYYGRLKSLGVQGITEMPSEDLSLLYLLNHNVSKINQTLNVSDFRTLDG